MGLKNPESGWVSETVTDTVNTLKNEQYTVTYTFELHQSSSNAALV